MAGVYEPSNNCEGTFALPQEDIDSQESDSELEGPDIDTDTSATSHTTLQQGPSSQYRRQRESAYSGTSPLDLLRLLIDREYECSELHKVLQSTQRRAEEAEQQLAVYITRFQSLKEDKVRAEWKLQEELTLYKIRYELEQEERVKANKEVIELRDQVKRARWDAMTAKEGWFSRAAKRGMLARAEEEWQKVDTQGRSMGTIGSETAHFPPWDELDIFADEFDILAADLLRRKHLKTVNEEQLKREMEVSMSFGTFPPLNGLLQPLEVPEVPVIPPSSFVLHGEPHLPSAPHSRTTSPTPAAQTYDYKINQVEIVDRPLESNSEVFSVVGSESITGGGKRESYEVLSAVGSGSIIGGGRRESYKVLSVIGSESVTGGGRRESYKVLSVVGSESITGEGGGPESTIGDKIWSELQTYNIEIPPVEQTKVDNHPLEPVSRGSSFHGWSTTKIPLVRADPPPRQPQPPLKMQRTPASRLSTLKVPPLQVVPSFPRQAKPPLPKERIQTSRRSTVKRSPVQVAPPTPRKAQPSPKMQRPPFR